MRFTIRDLLWLMVVVALAVGWWVDHQQQGRLRILGTLGRHATTGNLLKDTLLSNPSAPAPNPPSE